jgi:hypothetical protein
MVKPNWSSYPEDDKKFLIQLSISNRNYLVTIAIFIYSTLVSITALLVSLYSIQFSIIGFDLIWLLFFIIIILIYWIVALISFNKLAKVYIKKLNNQYQDIHKTLHPELFKNVEYYY